MSLLQVSDLTFCYEGSSDNIFEHVSFQIDTDWRLGVVARNGRGKTTLLKLLLGEYEYRGSITGQKDFEYFPFPPERIDMRTLDLLNGQLPNLQTWQLLKEFAALRLTEEMLYRPFATLSNGEQTKMMLAALFATEHCLLFIDEPTNHLDAPARALVRDYLKTKKSFLLVSHDRDFLDECIDHVLVINKTSVETYQGNFSTWWENKLARDAFEQAEHEKLKKEIGRLKESARQAGQWAANVEATKIGKKSLQYDTRKGLRAYIGEKSRKMSARRKNLEHRMERAVEEKSSLLKDVETADALKIMPLAHYKDVLLSAHDVVISYPDGKLLPPVTMELRSGDRIALCGGNGCGKTSFLKLLLQESGQVISQTDSRVTDASSAASTGKTCHRSAFSNEGYSGMATDTFFQPLSYNGTLRLASGLKISYVPQDASYLTGTLTEYAKEQGLDITLFFTLLRQLDFSHAQLEKRMEDYSAGQQKKVLLAASFMTPAHLYIWDEPLNYIDVFSRIQMEELILKFRPTLLFVEHDKTFTKNVATKSFCY